MWLERKRSFLKKVYVKTHIKLFVFFPYSAAVHNCNLALWRARCGHEPGCENHRACDDQQGAPRLWCSRRVRRVSVLECVFHPVHKNQSNLLTHSPHSPHSLTPTHPLKRLTHSLTPLAHSLTPQNTTAWHTTSWLSWRGLTLACGRCWAGPSSAQTGLCQVKKNKKIKQIKN